ncbi:MAG: hypothetical protein R2752_05235 [Vicinamibacterales bacterium]
MTTDVASRASRPAARWVGAALWTLALLQVVTIQPSRPFALPAPWTWEHGAFVAAFLLTSLGFMGSASRGRRAAAPGRRTIVGPAWPVLLVSLHLVVVGLLIALHPITTFGRDGSALALMAWLVAAASRLPVRREWVLMTGSACVAIVLAESLLSLGREPAPDGRPDYGDVLGDYGACGFLKPDLDLTVTGEDGGPARFVTNALGLRRAGAVGDTKPAGTRRVLFVGDSFVAGYRTDQADLVGTRLEARLNDPGGGTAARTEVWTAGAGDPGAAARVVQGCGARLAPDVVITGITLGNDVAQSWFEARGLPQDALDALLLPEDASRGPVGLLPVRLRASLGAWRLFRRAETILATDVIRPWYDEAPRAVHVLDPGHSIGLFYTRAPLPIVEEGYADLERSLDEVSAAATQVDAAALFVILPQRFQLTSREWDATLFAWGLDPSAFDRDAPDRRLAAICAARRLACVDLLEPFRAAAGGGPLYQPAGDMHWNRRGQAIAAEVLADRVRRMLGER